MVKLSKGLKVNKRTKQADFNTLLELTNRFPNEKACREFLEQERWHGTIVCVHCGCFRKIYRINDGKLFKCADCRKQFTVRVGSIFEDSALPLQKWFMAIYIFMAHKKGISSVQLGKDIGVRQATAWFMLHRIRYAVRTRSLEKPLNGIIEADETYVGGKPRFKGQSKTGRGTRKTAVFGIAQRNGIVRAEVIEKTNRKTLHGLIKQDVSPEATIMTDEWQAYNGLDKHFASHDTVNHGRKEYVRGDVHTNSIESFWALFKRGYVGTYHWMSKKHLDAYIDEFEFRVNSKHISDPQRFSEMLRVCEGRLTYDKLIAS